jgi:hypothetical protein
LSTDLALRLSFFSVGERQARRQDQHHRHFLGKIETDAMMFSNEDSANPVYSTTPFTTHVHNPAGEFEIAADFLCFRL